MKRALLPLLVLALGAGGVAAAQSQNGAAPKTILPGYWEYKTKVLGLTVDNKKKCLKAEEVEDFLTKPCNRHHTCVYPVKEIGDGKLLLDGYWQDKKGRRAKVHATGVYEPKSFSVQARGTSTQGIPIGATLEAKWLSATCPSS